MKLNDKLLLFFLYAAMLGGALAICVLKDNLFSAFVICIVGAIPATLWAQSIVNKYDKEDNPDNE